MQHEPEPARGGDILTRADRAADAEMGKLFLRRLERLVELRRGKWGPLSPDEEKTINQAIYSTLLDCLDLDVAETARALVRRNFGEPRRSDAPPETPAAAA